MRSVVFFVTMVLASLLLIDAQASSKSYSAQFGQRSYEIEVPDGDTSKPSPTIFVLHGGGGSGKQLRKSFDFSRLAGINEVVLVYPNGIGGHWNDGRRGGRKKLFKGEKPDDVAFLRALANDLTKKGISQPGQFYVVGVSNGGMMVQRLLCEASDMFVAGASIIAGLPESLKNCSSKYPRPILLINGDADPLMPWGGGGVGFRSLRGAVLSGPDTLSHWQKLNGCSKRKLYKPMPDNYTGDQTRAVKIRAKCKVSTQMIRIKDGGHHIPAPVSAYVPKSRKYKRRKKWLGRYNHDFDARDEVWAFFRSAGL